MDLLWNAKQSIVKWEKTLVTHNVNIHDAEYIESFYSNVLYFLEDKYLWKDSKSLEINYKKVLINDLITIYDLWWNGLLLEYNVEVKRNNDYKLFSKNFKSDWIRSVLLKNNTHFPATWWYFNFNKRYYTLVEGKNKLTNEISDIVYRWIIINPLEYLYTNNKI